MVLYFGIQEGFCDHTHTLPYRTDFALKSNHVLLDTVFWKPRAHVHLQSPLDTLERRVVRKIGNQLVYYQVLY